MILPIELIKQVDIYKYDPWDLPNLAPSSEKEWYFYCPRDRKYKNSARPNRVTGAGFWKATGTDRPIYSSNGAKCIGLKKSLVFYRGRAAKGIKTDWMMHEFRLPSQVEPDPNKKVPDKNLTPNDAWAICRIFKKTNSMAQRAISHSWASSLHDDGTSDQFFRHSNQFSSDNISCMTDHLSYTFKPATNDGFLDLETPLYRPANPIACKPSAVPLPYVDFASGLMISSIDAPESRVLNMKEASKNWGSICFGGEQHPFENVWMNQYRDQELGSIRSSGCQFCLPETADASDEWKLNMAMDSPPCPSHESTTSQISKCLI
ncbi:hypothetical protein L1887_36591 [Cichorium endivia]|nr:hypothetical protein L1887_36591 [Cichorium endivia]